MSRVFLTTGPRRAGRMRLPPLLLCREPSWPVRARCVCQRGIGLCASYRAIRAHTDGMELLPREERRWFVAAVALVLAGAAILLQPFDTIPVLGDASFAGRIIIAMGLGTVLRTLVLLFRALRRSRRRVDPDPKTR